MYAFSHVPGLYDNATQNLTHFKNQDWYKAVQKRRIYEEYKTDSDDSGFDFLPRREDECTSKDFDFPSKCLLGLEDDDMFQIKVKGKEYYKENLTEIYKNEHFYKDTYRMRKKWENKKVFELKNPGVPYVFFTLRANPTPV